jgi:hypothetical protein
VVALHAGKGAHITSVSVAVAYCIIWGGVRAWIWNALAISFEFARRMAGHLATFCVAFGTFKITLFSSFTGTRGFGIGNLWNDAVVGSALAIASKGSIGVTCKDPCEVVALFALDAAFLSSCTQTNFTAPCNREIRAGLGRTVSCPCKFSVGTADEVTFFFVTVRAVEVALLTCLGRATCIAAL